MNLKSTIASGMSTADSLAPPMCVTTTAAFTLIMKSGECRLLQGGGRAVRCLAPPPRGSLDFNLSPEGLVVRVLAGASLSLDGQHAIVPQGRGHCGGVHVLGQLAFVGEGVHDGPVCGQFLSVHLDLVVGCGNDDVLWGEISDIDFKLISVPKSLHVLGGIGCEAQGFMGSPELAEILREDAQSLVHEWFPGLHAGG